MAAGRGLTREEEVPAGTSPGLVACSPGPCLSRGHSLGFTQVPSGEPHG